MEWLAGLNRAVAYLEEHLLDEEIDLDHAARLACCSGFHFQRMFSYIADMPLSEYLRRRKMSRAAYDLYNTTEKIIDIALKYGYDSPTAFNRAFQGIHGVAPSAAREQGVTLKAFPPISFKLTIKGEAEMNYRVETKGPIRIAGVKRHFCMSAEESFANVPLFWEETAQSGIIPRILAAMDGNPQGLLGVCAEMSGKDFDYYIAAATNKPAPEGLEEYVIPQGTWAIFDCVGPMPTALQSLQKRIVTEWLPNSGYEYANLPDIEVYFDGDQQSENYRCEAWLPVVKSKG